MPKKDGSPGHDNFPSTLMKTVVSLRRKKMHTLTRKTFPLHTCIIIHRPCQFLLATIGCTRDLFSEVGGGGGRRGRRDEREREGVPPPPNRPPPFVPDCKQPAGRRVRNGAFRLSRAACGRLVCSPSPPVVSHPPDPPVCPQARSQPLRPPLPTLHALPSFRLIGKHTVVTRPHAIVSCLSLKPRAVSYTHLTLPTRRGV